MGSVSKEQHITLMLKLGEAEKLINDIYKQIAAYNEKHHPKPAQPIDPAFLKDEG